MPSSRRNSGPRYRSMTCLQGGAVCILPAHPQRDSRRPGPPEPETSARTPAGRPVSTEDVERFLEGLGWSFTEVSLLTDKNVNGEILLQDLTPKMCSGYGIPSLRLKILTTTSRSGHPSGEGIPEICLSIRQMSKMLQMLCPNQLRVN
jgi:hypothetical protein